MQSEWGSAVSDKSPAKRQFFGRGVRVRGAGKVSSSFGSMLLIYLQELSHVFRGPQDDWRPLVDVSGNDVQDSFLPSGSQSSRLLDDVGHWVTFVQ